VIIALSNGGNIGFAYRYAGKNLYVVTKNKGLSLTSMETKTTPDIFLQSSTHLGYFKEIYEQKAIPTSAGI